MEGRARPHAPQRQRCEPGLGLAVALHGRSAGRARHVVHGNLPESVTFCRDIRHATLRKRQFGDTLFVRAEKSFRLIFAIKNGR